MGTVGDAERVHDLIRLLPGGTIGGFEQPEILRWEQLTVPRRCGRLLCVWGDRHERQERQSQWQA
jgi:hypothetical protein